MKYNRNDILHYISEWLYKNSDMADWPVVPDADPDEHCKEPMDLENLDIDAVTFIVSFTAGGDWQKSTQVMVDMWNGHILSARTVED